LAERKRSLFPQFNHFEVFNFIAVDAESDKGAYFVKSSYASSTRVDVKQVEGLVVEHTQDV
jgi:hypothetical protein